MIIKPSFPSGFVTFCDDIRHEVTGKMTLVGVYGGQLVISGNLPVTLPQFCAIITFRFLPPAEPIKLTMKMFISGQDEPLYVAETDIDPFQIDPPVSGSEIDPDTITFAQIIGIYQSRGLIIKEPSAISVIAYIGDDEIHLGELPILVVSNPIISTMPLAD